MEDFGRIPEKKRMVIIGCTGAGKSSLLNVLAGCKMVQFEDDEEAEVQWVGKPKLFEAKASVNACTRKAAFANVGFLGNPARKFVAVDTPGQDDTEGIDITDPKVQEMLGEMAEDLHNKLQAMQYVNLILVIHNDVHSNRLNPATYKVLELVANKFKEAELDVWDHVVMAYSKCNEGDRSWKMGLDKKKKALQGEIKDKKALGCKVDVPVITLGGVEYTSKEEVEKAKAEFESDSSSSSSSSSDSSSSNPSAVAPSLLPKSSEGLEELWELLQAKPKLQTTELKVFEGDYAKFKEILEEKEKVEAALNAEKDFFEVVAKFFVLSLVLAIRSAVVPKFLAIFVLNFPNHTLDDILIFVAAAYLIGFQKTALVGKLAVNKYAIPLIEPHLGKFMGPAQTTTAAATATATAAASPGKKAPAAKKDD